MTQLVLHNVKLIDETVVDIALNAGKVTAIREPGTVRGGHGIDLTGRYVSSGWIDYHVHVFPEWHPYGDTIDEVGVKHGVTTVVDAGSCGADRIGELFVATQDARTNLVALLNASRIGLARIDELSNLAWLDPDRAARAVENYRHRIIGLKARVSQSVVGHQGIKPLHKAKEMAKRLSLPLTVHVGSAPPSAAAILSLLEKGDVVTHYLHGKKNSLFSPDGTPIPALTEALQRGVQLDVGHGSASFSFRVAEVARARGVPLGTISTDMYRQNRLHGPVNSLANVMTKFLHIGYKLDEVIAAVTRRPAERIGQPKLGRIEIGEQANLTIFSVVDEPLVLVDSEGERRTAKRHVRVEGVVANGEFLTC